MCCLTSNQKKVGFNTIHVRLTGYRPSVFRNGICYDVDEYEIISCNVDPEKGKLTYETNSVAANLLTMGGIKVHLENKELQINSLHFITEEELNLMKSRGITVFVSD